MSEEKFPDEPRAVFKCKDKDCTKPHYHLDPAIEALEELPKGEVPDRLEVEVTPDDKADLNKSKST